MDTNPLFTLALGLESPWMVSETQFEPAAGTLRLRLDFPRGSTFICPECGAGDCPVHDTVERTWRHLDFFQHQAFLTARVPRVDCLKCGVKQVAVSWARPGSGFTLLFEAYALVLARHMPVRPAAALLRITDNRLWRILKHHVSQALEKISLEDLRQLGIDETSARKRHDYISLFFDMVQRRLMFATRGKDAATVSRFRAFLEQHGGKAESLQEASMDMSPAFQKGVRENFPNAGVTFDRFHVVKLLNDALDKVRRNEWRDGQPVKGARFLLLRNVENLTAAQAALLEELRTRNATLARAWQLKENFRDFYRQTSLEDAHGFLKGWIADAIISDIDAIKETAWTFFDHFSGIMRWHISRIDNAVMEALAGLVQAAKAKARGYRNHDNLITIAYLVAGKLQLPTYPLKTA